MKLKRLILLIVPCLAFGGWLIFRDEPEDVASARWLKMQEPYRADVGPNNYWIKPGRRGVPSSNAGKICGLLDIVDAEEITGLTQDKLYEHNSHILFPTPSFSPANSITIHCEISTGLGPKSGYLTLEINVREFGSSPMWDSFEEFLATGQQAAKEGQFTVEMLGKGYEGEVSTTQGGYVVRTCPKGGQYIVTLATVGKGGLGVLGAWREPLLRVLAETERIGACALADKSGPTSENSRGARKVERLHPISPWGL